METLIKILEPVLMFSVACFPITTAIMIFSLKRLGYDPVGSSVKSKWSFDIDMKFFANLRNAYMEERGNKIIPRLNVVSFYFNLIGLIGVMLPFAVYESLL